MALPNTESRLLVCKRETPTEDTSKLHSEYQLEFHSFLKNCSISKGQCSLDETSTQPKNAWEREMLLRNLDVLSLLACPPPPDVPAYAQGSSIVNGSRTSRASSGSRSPRSPVRLKGHPVTIMTIDDRHQLKLNEAALKRILLNPQYRNCPISIVAVAGTFRKGKSFLLDYFLRYLGAGGHSYWMGMEDEPLRGFSWRGGSERDTDGVVLWSNPFLLRKRASVAGESDSQVALFLMDTQGTFDQTSTFKDCTTLFALTTMVSSVIVYNLMHNIQRDDLQHLQYFTEYAKLALVDTERSPFQDLVFLVRDWSFPYEKPYGFDGGQMLLSRRLEAAEDSEIQELRHDLYQTFEHVKCFLMPHPGLEVATKPDYDGRLSAMDPAFRVHLREFIEATLKQVVKKKICGSSIKCFELFEYFKEYTRVMQSSMLPEPMTLYTATAEANHLAALADALNAFSECMESQVGVMQPYSPLHRLRAIHALCKQRALELFDDRKKMGTAAMTMGYRTNLVERIDAELTTYEERNRAKRVFGTLRTPFVIFGRKSVRKMQKMRSNHAPQRLPNLLMPNAVEVCATNSDSLYAQPSTQRIHYRVGVDYNKMTMEERRCASRMFWKRTPVVIPAVASLFFLIYFVLTLVKLKTLAVIPKILCFFFLFLFLCWMTAWYTGRFRRPRNALDNIVDQAVFRLFAF